MSCNSVIMAHCERVYCPKSCFDFDMNVSYWTLKYSWAKVVQHIFGTFRLEHIRIDRINKKVMMILLDCLNIGIFQPMSSVFKAKWQYCLSRFDIYKQQNRVFNRHSRTLLDIVTFCVNHPKRMFSSSLSTWSY